MKKRLHHVKVGVLVLALAIVRGHRLQADAADVAQHAAEHVRDHQHLLPVIVVRERVNLPVHQNAAWVVLVVAIGIVLAIAMPLAEVHVKLCVKDLAGLQALMDVEVRAMVLVAHRVQPRAKVIVFIQKSVDENRFNIK